METRISEMDRLKQIMDRLRGTDGCPWDREQTYETLATFLLEETYEVLDAMRLGAPGAHCEELGDLLFQIVFQCRIAKERGDFDIEDVMREMGDLLFTIANVARRAGIDPEMALQGANRKFVDRFRYIEERLGREGLTMAPENRERMETLWQESKRKLRKTSPGRRSPSAGISGSAPRRARRATRS